MLRDLLRFLWTAFIDHWATWVTGTGFVGLLLWALNYFERVRGTPMKLRTNVLILFCTFWFFATFAAWHDADKNLDAAKTHSTQDAKDLDSCKGDLKAETGRAEILDSQLHITQSNFNTQTKTLSNQQQTMDSQQGAMNSCVIALGKANTPEPQNTTIQFLGANPSGEKANHHTYMLALTNKVIAAPIRVLLGANVQ